MKKTFILIKRELKKFFTNKRLLMAMFFPGILIFVVYSLIGNLMNSIKQEEVSKDYKYNIALTNNYSLDDTDPCYFSSVLLTYLQEEGFQDTVTTFINTTEIDEYKNKVTNKEYDLLVVFTDNFENEVNEYDFIQDIENRPDISLFYNASVNASEQLYTIALSLCDAMYKNFTINISNPNPNLGKGSFMANQILSFIFPIITISLLYSATLSFCPDSIAGEKEKGTLFSLFVTPLKRSEVAISKVVSLTVVSLVSGITCGLGLILSLPKMLQGIEFVISPVGYLLLLLSVISLMIFFVSFASLFSTIAKTSKEANSYLGPLTGVLLVLSMIPIFVDCSSLGFSFVPILGFAQSLSFIMRGQIDLLFIGLSCIANIVYSAILIYLIVKLFNNEKVMVKR
ncbi:MAG: ABC transporter permease [Bacilli bacterium]